MGLLMDSVDCNTSAVKALHGGQGELLGIQRWNLLGDEMFVWRDQELAWHYYLGVEVPPVIGDIVDLGQLLCDPRVGWRLVPRGGVELILHCCGVVHVTGIGGQGCIWGRC